MILLNVIRAKYLYNYVLELTFNNGETKSVDLKAMIFEDQRPIFEPLRDLDYFKNFTIEANTIAWANGLDPAPEYLYQLAQSQNIDQQPK